MNVIARDAVTKKLWDLNQQECVLVPGYKCVTILSKRGFVPASPSFWLLMALCGSPWLLVASLLFLLCLKKIFSFYVFFL